MTESPDGAHLNYTAHEGLSAVLGDADEQSTAPHMSDDDFARYIRECPEDAADSYDGSARLAARYMLQWLETHPLEAWRPLEDEIDWKKFEAAGSPWDDFETRRSEFVAIEGAWDRICEEAPALRELGMTGFMAGWAWNAARKVLNLGPQANPAIVTVGGSD
jgi:hypothetical protein